MSDLQSVVERFEIEALRGEFTDAIMMRDYDRFASLFTLDGAWRIPYVDVELVGREEIRAGIEQMQGLWEFFVQISHPGTITLEGDAAVGRAYVSEIGQKRDGTSELNYSLYHDRYKRTPDGWKFARARLRGEIRRHLSPDRLRAARRGPRPLIRMRSQWPGPLRSLKQALRGSIGPRSRSCHR